MTHAGVDFHHEARAEVDESIAWYFDRSPDAAENFIAALDDSFERILDSPTSWPQMDGATHVYLMRRFSRQVIYRPGLNGIYIIAVAHTSRQPGYWRSRM